MKKLVCVLAWVLGFGAQAGVYDSLTPEQKARVEKGEQVFFTQDVSGSSWPKAFIFQLIDSTPEEAAAVFHDYDRHSSYIPNLTRSKVAARANATTAEVDYTLKSSIITENYTVRDVVSGYDSGASYQVEWKKVRADSTKAIEGSVRFEPHGAGTIVAYYNWITPGMPGAGLVKGQAMKQVKETCQAVVNQVQKQRRNDQPLLQAQLQALRAALAR